MLPIANKIQDFGFELDAASRVEQLESALKLWHETATLGQHPLAFSDVVTLRLRKAHRIGPTARGVALQAALSQCLESLKLSPQDSSLHDHNTGQAHTLLTELFVNKRNKEYVQDLLLMSRPTMYRTRSRAIQLLSRAFQALEYEATMELETFGAPSIPLLSRPISSTFLGRDALVDWITSSITNASKTHPPVIALWGLPGVGKTSLVERIAAAPDVQDHFCDGILWASLGSQPNLAGNLTNWSEQLGLDLGDESKDQSVSALSQAIARAIGRRRMLIVLDDAWTSSDVLFLWLGGPNCAHLVTTRFPTIAAEIGGEQALHVADLGDTESVNLLRALAPDAVRFHEDEAFAFVKSTGGLPLALTLAGNMLRTATIGLNNRRIAEAWTELGDIDARLQLSMPQTLVGNRARAEIGRVSLLSVINTSVDALGAQAQAALVALAVFPSRPNSFSECAALTVANCDANALDQLVEAGLIECCVGDRYALHQSIATYAAWRLGKAVEPLVQLSAFYAERCESLLRDSVNREHELVNMCAAARAAEGCALWNEHRRIVGVIAPYLEGRAMLAQARQMLTEVAKDNGEANQVLQLARIEWRLGYLDSARARLQTVIAAESRHPPSLRLVAEHQLLAWIEEDRGDVPKAIDQIRHAIAAGLGCQAHRKLPELIANWCKLSSTPLDASSATRELLDLQAEDSRIIDLITADVLVLQGRWKEALNRLQPHLANFGNTRPPARMAIVAALAYYCLGQHQTLEHEIAGALLVSAFDPVIRAELMLWRARCERTNGDFERALITVAVGLDNAGEAHDITASLLCELAMLALAQDNLPDANAWAQSALATALRSNEPTAIVLASIAMGQVESRKGSAIGWRERFRDAWSILAKSPSMYLTMQALQSQAECYDRHGDVWQAESSRAELDQLLGGPRTRSQAA